MPSVKYAISAYVADGTTTDYLITWDYLDEDHIAVYVDGTSNADPTASHTFSKLNDTTLRITDELGNAIAAGAEIEIRRETPLTTRAITFADGSALLASDLNKNSDYLLYSMQEVLDTVDAAAQDGALAAQVATEGFRDEAEGHKNDAQAAQTAAETARDTTQTYLATVQSDATDADNHRIAAAASETAAAASQAAAATSETNSATSANASAASATASAASETAAAASETAAAASETAAAASETAAAASATAAATSEANAAASFDDFDDRYLGAKATAPTVDNDGDALLTGALYWNTTNDTMYVWSGSSWDTFSSTTGISDGAGSQVLYITPSGTVGINHSNPSVPLQVDGTSNELLRLNSTDSTQSSMGFALNNDVKMLIGADLTATGDRNFFVYDEDAQDTRMLIDGSGHMSINGGITTTNASVYIQDKVNRVHPQSGDIGPNNLGTLHLQPNSTSVNNVGTSITFGAHDSTNKTQAHIAVHSDGSYGTKMSFGTTQSYALGSRVAMFIDQYGRVTTPLQPHIFGTIGRGSTSTGYADRIAIYSSRGLSWTGGSTNGIVIPTTGVYMITMTIIGTSGSGRFDSNVYRNGNALMNNLNNTDDTGYRQRALSGCVACNTGDVITFRSDNWYTSGNGFDAWQTASVTLIG
ncbi:putative tail fiber protein [Roseobacter phage CRP-403]|uniref:Tail fiber protein n=1 Tax=Roseobacter phage CRP-403 TaxID=3072849 RepID=A0AAX3ZWX4_9CAUD|nr:putative tail fiber protein [Roseobacter phage CRP-403]